ncbi:putative Zn-dependent hydrolase [Gottschalkia purinilytica]|uniref:UPF0173 metal-dependent hydrolase CLPU_1c01150 n=1 Tax=Gottschalkia purinilytica TaxID=1503 RepID=A0A0L0WET6_GOTPU|nr:metal-dependent hydrolase [Gottschalkia purinilytica]KNF09950.1 putative Zn-dependent hydrolase [Gottschalkia purinilytica]
MKIQYLSHSSFIIENKDFKAIIDPFISGNPTCPIRIEDLKDLTHIFLTHAHGDHFGDTIEIAKKFNCTVICNFEIGHYLSNKGINNHTMHIGGRFSFEFGRVKMTPALHGSSIFEGENIIYGGNPCGFLIEINNKIIYHAGDTGLTMDMKLLEDENVDLALIPIGGNFTMDINDAVKAIEFIKPKAAIPMHFNTFDIIQANPDELKNKVKDTKIKILQYGEIIELK